MSIASAGFPSWGTSHYAPSWRARWALPSSTGAIDVDQQRDLFSRKFEAYFGEASLSALTNPAIVDKVLQRFFLQAELRNGPSATTPGMAALGMLRAGDPQFAANLVISNF